LTGERVVRRLAAILAADVAGYSRLMGRDENGTLARLKAHRTERLEPVLARHGGRLVKLTGDGALVEFPSAVDALGAAIEFQQAMTEINQDQQEDRRIVFRIGLHLGDLIVDGDDLYGDGVNIAARLEAEAPPGGIIVSGAIREAVEGRLKTKFHALGELTLKNIERPIRASRVEWDAADWKAKAVPAPKPVTANEAPAPALALPDKPSIAVLPFQNMSGDPEQEYFADGIVEDIITALSRFKSLFVIARNSSFTYKGKAVDVKQLGRELGVRYVLEGSVRKAADKVRITGQLIDSATGIHLWADRFDGSLEDVFELQDRVTTSVVGAVAPKVDQAEIERAKRKPVGNSDAYDCYLRGMAKAHDQTLEAWEEALLLFYRAIELDPNFATPYAMAARAYAARRQHGKVVDKDWEEAETRRLAMGVAVMDRDDALALCWAGQTLAYMCGDCETGAAMVDQGLAINPNLAVGWQLRAGISSWLGQHEVAIEQLARASRLNPKDPEAFRSEHAMAISLLLLGQYDEAVTWVTKSLAHLPTFAPAMRVSAVANALAGNLDEARRMMAEVRRAEPNLRMANLRSFLPYRRPQDVERVIEGARLAGLPE
jgi:TolB-like protein/class 3 adenylate cyclase/Flp pilus assembly protein TadD